MDDGGRKKRINPKHYIGRAGKHGGVWGLALVASFMGASYIADEVTNDSFDESSNVVEMQKFEQRLSDLKTVKQNNNFTSENLFNNPSVEQQNFARESYAFLADVMINEDNTVLTEKDRMELMNKFDAEVDDLSNYGYMTLDEESAARLDKYRIVDTDLSNAFIKTEAAQTLNKVVIVEEIGMHTIFYLLFMLPVALTFPRRKDWKENKTMNKWAKEPPTKPKPPKHKH